MTTHYAKLKSSERLQLLFKSLKNGEIKTTAELQSETGSMAIHSDVSELRNNGFTINCKYIKTENQHRIYGYQMVVNNRKAA